MPTEFTLVLTKGAHTVSASTASAICAAIENGEKLISVELDQLDSPETARKTILALSHVIGLIEVPPRFSQATQIKATHIRGLRATR